MSPIKLSDQQAKELCKLGQQEKCCSYLIMDTGGFCCAKQSMFESIITQRRLNNAIKAIGDNCSGPPDFATSIKHEN